MFKLAPQGKSEDRGAAPVRLAYSITSATKIHNLIQTKNFPEKIGKKNKAKQG